MKRRSPYYLLLCLLAVAAGRSLNAAASCIERYDVVWESPSTNSFGSMPLGNGDVGVNVWVEPNGDLLFYISKVDAYDAGHLLPKLGRVRVRLNPALAARGFQQTLLLREGTVDIRAGEVNLQVWVDANSPVIRVSGTSKLPLDARVSFETLRECSEQDDKADRLAWGYRNTSSAWMDRVRSQNTLDFAAKVGDPIINRTSGCRLSGDGLVRDGKRSLRMSASRTLDIAVRVLSSQKATLTEWFAELDQTVAENRPAHLKWWRAFWDRSDIIVSKCGDGPVRLDQCRFTQFPQGSLAYRDHSEIGSAENAFQLSQRYALERFCEACAGRGVVPPPYNGSIFTMDMPAGAMGFNAPKPGPTSADERDWGILSFMWQNTRHPYWAMPARGDYDTLRPGMQFVRDGLDVCRDRCRNIFHHDGAFIMEASWWKNAGVFDWSGVPQHLRYHFLASIELPAIMCEYYEHTRDRGFLDEILLPCADEFIKFYELQFPKRDDRGKMVMAPAATVETYQPVTNPNTEITGLRFLLAKLLSFDIGAERAQHWAGLLREIPEVPTRRIKGLDLLAPGGKYAPGREICESPEMYSVYPFRQAWLGNDALLACARQSLHLRTVSLDGTADGQAVETGGWQAAPVQAAYLGLAREAARLTSINFNDQFVHWTDNVDPNAPWPARPRARFAAFWETKMDYTPDNDHGAVSANALQSMLLQSDGKKINLLPAWPEDWDVSFKLHAAYNTTVECEYRDGKVQSLRVTPRPRKSDLVDMSSQAYRVRSLVSVACADHNYLFDLPSMLDGCVTPDDVKRLKTSGPWLAKYGESLYGVKSGPFASGGWGGSVFRSNTVYLHMLDCPAGKLQLPALDRKLVSSKCLTGGRVEAVQTADGLTVSLDPRSRNRIDTIIKLEFDGPIEPMALSAPYAGSLTTGKTAAAESSKAGFEPGNAVDACTKTAWVPDKADGASWLEVDLGEPKAFDRVEIQISNPGHRRGQAKGFNIRYRQPNGSWATCCEGAIFGDIYGKRIDQVTARFVRLGIAAPGVKQFDLFPPRQGE